MIMAKNDILCEPFINYYHCYILYMNIIILFFDLFTAARAWLVIEE